MNPFSIICRIALVLSFAHGSAALNATTEIINGFSTTPGTVNTKFETILTDPYGVFAFGFLPIGPTKLDLAIIHLPSSLAVWRAGPPILANWASTTTFAFDGNLVLTDTSIQKSPLWSSNANLGDYIDIQNTSNLRIVKFSGRGSPTWQSFDHPFDTLVQGQNLSSKSLGSLISADKQYSFRIRISYIALYMELRGGQEINYWQHTALKFNGNRDIYAQVNPKGFLGLYFADDGTEADLIPFDSFNRVDLGFHRITVQTDGNLNGYYWDNKTWNMVYTTVTEPCGLPGKCGSYGLCVPGKSACSCLVNGTDGCLQQDTGDFCSRNSDFTVVRGNGVTVEYTDIMPSKLVGSLTDCEKACENNCTCWGALYVNTTKNCYMMDYPIQTVETAGSTHHGYFKVRSQMGGGGDRGGKKGHAVVITVVVIFTVIFAAAAYGGYWFWDKKRNSLPRVQLGRGQPSQEMASGQHRDIKTTAT